MRAILSPLPFLLALLLAPLLASAEVPAGGAPLEQDKVMPCGAHTSCASCNRDNSCGWCESSGECVMGTITGPLGFEGATCDRPETYAYGFCKDGEWSRRVRTVFRVALRLWSSCVLRDRTGGQVGYEWHAWVL